MGLPLWTKLKRQSTYWLCGKQRVLGVVVSKEGHADNLLAHESQLITLKKVQP